MSARTVHAWGFFDPAGQRGMPSGVATSDEDPFHTWLRVESNVRHFGGSIERANTLRTLAGVFDGIDFETPPREDVDRMWHWIRREGDSWSAK